VRGRQTWTKAELREAMNSPGVKFNHLHVSSIHAARLSLTREITEFLTAIFGSVAIPMQSLTFCHGSEQATHIDYPYVCRQKRLAYMAASWIPLEDVHQLAGPLAYYPGAHKPSVCGFFDWGNGNILAGREGQTRTGTNFAAWLDQRIASAGIKPKTLLVRKGDLLIWHCNMPHTGTRVQDTSLTRKSYVTHYTGLADYPANWIRPDVYQPSYRTASGVVIDFPWSKAEGKLPSWQQYFSPRPR
jgi:ectoine hydroxylase-related dioxygenase (phytanoyl-CoA dioxygenase family)